MSSDSFSAKRILVPIDFSEHSHSVLTYAKGLAEVFTSDLVLLYVVQTSVLPLEAYELTPDYDTLIGWGEQNIANLKREEFGDDTRVATLVRTGEPYLEIVQVAKEQQCDLIVMSTHGRSGIRHLMLGSTTERVVRTSPIPVLTRRMG